MPFVVQKTSQCPASKPYGVFTETAHGSGKTRGYPHGCFPTEDAAREQQKALYASVPEAKSEAPRPPNLREAEPTAAERCGSCHMYDHAKSVCWGFGNTTVRPNEVCDAYSPEPDEAKSEVPPMSTTDSPVLTPHIVEWRRERAAALSETQRKRPETRQSHEALELREASPDGKRTLRSYASVFDSPYMVRASGYRFDEVIRPGAFKRTLGTNPDVVFRTEHSGPPLAATWSGDLRLGEDSRGLWYEVDLDATDPDVQSLISKVQRGVYRESSFAFRVPKDGDRWNDEHDEREVLTCELDRGDVSVVTFGASRETGKHMVLRSEEAIAALQDLSFEQVYAAFHEWRDHTLLSREERVGKVISSQSAEVLRTVLGLIADADDAVDEAEAMLADFLDIPNPDEDADDEVNEGDVTSAEQLGKLGRSEEDEKPSAERSVVLAANDTEDLLIDFKLRSAR